MNWFASIGVGVLSAPIVGIVAGTATLLALDWLRVSLREGAAGFFIVAMTLFATFVGLVVGIMLARGVFITAPTFGKSFGLTVGSCFVISLVGLGIAGLFADPPPRVDGRPLDLAFELRMPVGVTVAYDAQAAAQPYATIIKLSNGESAGFHTLQLDQARVEDGRQIIPGLIAITTRTSRKMLNIYLDDARSLLFDLSFPGTPRPADFEWTPWREAAYKAGTSKPSSESAYAVRTVVRKVPPPPTQAELQAQEDAKQEAAFRALSADAPIAQWLEFTRYGVPQARIDAAITAIRARPTFAADMKQEMLTGEYESSRTALRSLTHMRPPATELADTVAVVGDEIATRLRALDPALPEAQQEQRNDISTRFSAWMEAARALQGHDAVTFVPQLQHILEPARERQASDVLRIDVVRVASYYLHQWAGIAPLPTDPPPR